MRYRSVFGVFGNALRLTCLEPFSNELIRRWTLAPRVSDDTIVVFWITDVTGIGIGKRRGGDWYSWMVAGGVLDDVGKLNSITRPARGSMEFSCGCHICNGSCSASTYLVVEGSDVNDCGVVCCGSAIGGAGKFITLVVVIDG